MESFNKPIVIEEFYDDSIENVWDALTNLKQMRKWYFNNLEDFRAEIGFITQFEVFNETRKFTHNWEITEVQPYKKLTYSWKFNEYPGESFSTFEVSKTKNGSKLKLSVKGLESFPSNIPEFTTESCIQGWDYFIGHNLRNYLEKNKTNKRSKDLVVFSHQHHHGLVFCNRLKNAKNVKENILQRYIYDFWDNDLKNHFEMEEQLFQHLITDNEILNQFILDHAQIKELIEQILVAKIEILNLSLELTEKITNHIRFEERTLFPWLQRNLSAEELEIIGKNLNNITVSCHFFKPEFWKES